MSRREKFSILSIDDELINLHIINYILSQPKIEISSFTSGEEAMKQLIERNFDLVITDFNLGDINGEAVLKKVRELSINKQIKTPVILVTALSNINKSIFEKMGFDHIMFKPVNRSELVAIVDHYNKVI